MDFITKLFNKISYLFSSSKPKKTENTNNRNKTSIMPQTKSKSSAGEISMMSDMTDEQIQIKQEREKYFDTIKNSNYKVKKGDTLEKIAEKYNVSIKEISDLNGLNEKTFLRPGDTLKIPDTKRLKNVKNLKDVAKAMGVSIDFLKQFKRIEDSQNLPDNKFHNTPYKDKNGVLTIGIGHVVKPGEKQKLSDTEVCELFAKDLLKAESLLIDEFGKTVYEKFPQSIKEALLDMVFNKGISIINKCEGLKYCLKIGKYEAAINKMTYNKATKTNKEMSGLSKRRLFDISIAIKGYKDDKIPQSNINTIQNVYNRGIELLRAESKENNWNFKAQLEGYNKEVRKYFGDKVKIKYITQ